MKKISIRLQVFLTMGFMTLLLLIIGGVSIRGLASADEALHSMYDQDVRPIGDLSQIERLFSGCRMLMSTAILEGSDELFKANAQKITSYDETIRKTWMRFATQPATSEEKILIDKFTADYEKLSKEALMPAVAALNAKDPEKLKAIYLGAGRKLNTPVKEDIEALVKMQVQQAEGRFALAGGRSDANRYVAIATLAVGTLAAIIAGILLLRAIVRPLRLAASVSRAVASGDLTSSIEVDRTDEIGQFLQALKDMNAGLARIVGEVRRSAGAIAAGTREIAAGNQDLSQRTEEQASSLEETAASMEELTSTVKQNADNARQANQLAASASQVAIQGGEVVGEVVTTMGAINDSSKKIADIIGVIDGIAFQTNILALNAAVEAARAGEQGRGFAVVASEVRNLAQRSAAAAKEIKALIEDSVGKVDSGQKLVDQAGSTMAEVVASIRRVTDIMAEITAASEEQSAGIGQVNGAITQMDQATQQNAALVEEAAAAAESMQDQTQQLTQAVAVFKLEAGAASTAAPAALARIAQPQMGPDGRSAGQKTNVGSSENLAARAAVDSPAGRVLRKTGT